MIHIESTHSVCISLKTHFKQFGSFRIFGPFHIFGYFKKLVEILPGSTQILPSIQISGSIVRTPGTGSHLPVAVIHIIGYSIIGSHFRERPVVGILAQRITNVGMPQQTNSPRRHVFQIRRLLEVFHRRLEQVVASGECHQKCR